MTLTTQSRERHSHEEQRSCARHRRLVRHRRSHGGAAREGGLQGLRHQQAGSPGGPAIVRDADPRRDQRCVGRGRRQGGDAAGGPHRSAREQRRLQRRACRSRRELDRAGPGDLRHELLRARPDDTRRRASHATPGEGRIINIGSVFGFLPMPYGALYAATKHAVEGYSESLDHELRTRGIRVSVIEPAYTKTQFDANLLEADAKLDEYREVRAALDKSAQRGDGNCRPAKRRGRRRAEGGHRRSPETPLPAGALASRLRLLRRFAPAGLVDAGIRKEMRLP